jgi:hypothetical protein
MITHVESPYPKLVVYRKLAIVKELVVTNHSRKLGKKQFEPFGCAITSYFCVINP